MLTRIHIDNYKCLTNFDLRLDNLTLLAGANGCGKSAVFEVMDKLRDLGDTRVEKLFLADDLTRWTTKREQRVELEFSTDAGVLAYKLVVEHKLRKGAPKSRPSIFCATASRYFRIPIGSCSSTATTATNPPIAGSVPHWRQGR